MDLPVPAGTVLAKHYRVDRLLGAGSMGVVATGWHLELDQPVAIKFPNPGAFPTDEALARFRREVRAAARIRSNHVVRVLDVGILEDRLPFMVMEMLEGTNLEEELAARGPLPVTEAVGYVLQAIEVLAEAHAASIVHRDLKPANLFLARQPDQSKMVKVLDFGVAKSIANSGELRLTRTGAIVGSPLYMAPEQLRAGTPLDCRVDIWALGAILFQLVTGHTPYEASSVAELYAKLLRDPPTQLARYRADLPPGFAAVVLCCLATDPANRFTDVSALADALLPFAPLSAQVNAQRARGVLFGTETLTAGSLVPDDRVRALSAPGENVGSWAPSSWGQSRPAPAPGRARPTLLLAVLALIIPILGATLYFSAKANLAPAKPALAARPALPAPPAVIRVPAAALPGAATSVPAVSATSSPSVVAAPSAAPSASAGPEVHEPSAQPQQAPRPRPRTSAPPSITDDMAVFGGRK